MKKYLCNATFLLDKTKNHVIYYAGPREGEKEQDREVLE